jgi:hypothetical protein
MQTLGLAPRRMKKWTITRTQQYTLHCTAPLTSLAVPVFSEPIWKRGGQDDSLGLVGPLRHFVEESIGEHPLLDQEPAAHIHPCRQSHDLVLVESLPHTLAHTLTLTLTLNHTQPAKTRPLD